MELLSFLKTVKRYIAIIILVPVVTAIISYLLVLRMPEKFVSHARLAASIANKSQQLVNDNAPQEARINEEFDNLLQTLTLNRIVDRVSYKLIIHDLEGKMPFRKLAEKAEPSSSVERAGVIKRFTAYYDNNTALDLTNSDDKELHKLLKAMKYDREELKKSLGAYRLGNSEYIHLEYTTENPLLSAFILNTLSNEFISYYTTVYATNRSRSVNFLDSLMHAKQSVLMTQMETIKKYKIENGILNVDDQARTIYGQIADIETKKSTAQKDMVAYSVAIKNIDSRFNPGNRKYLESSVSGINSDIVNTKEQIKSINEVYVQSGFNAKYKPKLDSLQKKLTTQIHAQTDNYSYNPSVAKENLVTQKLSLEVSRDLAQNSVKTLDNELGKLNSNLQSLVPNLATLQAFQANIDVANKEYQEILQKYNQASLEANYVAPIRLAETAMPGDALPGKGILLVALSGVASLILCLLVIFVLFYFDRSILSKEQLHSTFGIPVIGSLNRINGTFLNLKDIWNEKATDANSRLFKNSLRSIRHEIEDKIDNGTVLAVASLDEGEGKTFFTVSLAYAFSKIDKKVLIIDGNFMHPDISNTIKAPNYIERYLAESAPRAVIEDSVNIIGNRGGDNSLLEISNTDSIKEFFAVLKTMYDLIIIETSAFESLNKANAREWIGFADQVVIVFESGRPVNSSLLAEHVSYLQHLGNKLIGMVLNKVASVPVPATSGFQWLLDKPKKTLAA